jgi:adenine deaminase
MKLKNLIEVAKGAKKADLIIRNCKIVNVLTCEIEKGKNIAIYGGLIAGVGDYYNARRKFDAKGNYVSPAFINGHIHIESSMLHPVYYAKAVVPRGISTVVTDLHEITNVCGIEGIKFIMKWAKEVPLEIMYMVPSCVPATDLGTSGSEMGVEQIDLMLNHQNVLGLGEMMNFIGVINGQKDVLNKIELAKDFIIDGHAPKLSGKDLNAYIASGIYSEHESTQYSEGQEKLRKGMYLMIREGTTEKNLEELLPLVTPKTADN